MNTKAEDKLLFDGCVRAKNLNRNRFYPSFQYNIINYLD